MAEDADNSQSCLNAILKADFKEYHDLEVKADGYSSDLLKNLKQQFENGIFCDLVLISAIDSTK